MVPARRCAAARRRSYVRRAFARRAVPARQGRADTALLPAGDGDGGGGGGAEVEGGTDLVGPVIT